ncbi:TIGR03086 family metal-binding protein [Kribbella sp.]|uniref:TIGR03086 family metal-binding protein n=1 Tax=Kribbella sp. TaxID=1871183 RepID=UPI002D4A6831|nr:TIGR03086 family metal-binding protein [Kribbella sp.]HZX06437.1 TIGR03086 family metal-binding protein [Kribbella sp.]
MDVVELHNRTVANFAELVAGVAADQWSAPTPCTDWDVRALVNHVVGEERWTPPLMEGRTIAEVGNALDGDLLEEDPAGAASAAAREAEAAATRPIGKVHLSYGDEDPREYLRQLAADHLIHGWDLAVAIGVPARMDAELVAEVGAWFADREELYRSAGMIGVRLAGFTDPSEALLAAFGRDPRWTPALPVVERFGTAFGAGDLATVMSLVTDDVVFESTSPAPDGGRFEGADAVRAEWAKLFADTADPRFETEATVVFGDRAVVRWRYSWATSSGDRGHVRGVDVLRLRDGRITEKFSYVKG